MKKYLVILMTGLIFSTVAFAQQGFAIAFVNPTALLAAHPAGQAAAALLQQRDAELQPLLDEIQLLQTKSQTADLNADDRARATLLIRTVEEVRQRYVADIQSASAPALLDINTAIAMVAQQNGYTLVLDGEIASAEGLGLVVYADPSVVFDITEEVIAFMQNR